jgi:hypothetical protein
MVGVAEDDIRAGGHELIDVDSLDGARGSNGHEGGRPDLAMRRGDLAETRTAVDFAQSE